MKKLLLSPLSAIAAALYLTIALTPIPVHAQQLKQNNEGEIRVKITQKSNGKSHTIEKVFSAEDKEALNAFLKEYHIDLSADDLRDQQQLEIHIRKGTGSKTYDDVYLQAWEDEPEAITQQSQAFLGVLTIALHEENSAISKGVKVTGVIPGSAAEEAGLQEGDIITRVGDKDITDPEQFRQTIRSFKPGEKVEIVFFRNGSRNQITATLGKKDEFRNHRFMQPFVPWGEHPVPPMLKSDRLDDIPFLGVAPADTDDSLEGVRVGKVFEESTAEELGLQQGDVIVKVNEQPVKHFKELKAIIAAAKPGETITVEWIRDGKSMVASAVLKSKAESGVFGFWRDDRFPFEPMPWTPKMWREPDEMTPNEIQRAIEQLEKRIEELKNQLKNLSGDDEAEEETHIVISMEDTEPATLKIEDLTFSPNPSKGQFTLRFTLPEKGKTTVKIFDLQNKEVYSETLGRFTGKYEKQIDLSNQAKGIYLLHITQNDKSLHKKIVIQ
ncbi:MAG: hypothetical protein KatS3mg031_0957 [Chitinophagales bacterium]|nr:MAG: hypothetical protein KatS3mg031_0957 [Chitinophagales bacterium]